MRKVSITFTCILNGDMILLKKNNEYWEIPQKELEPNITSTKSTIRLVENIFDTSFEELTNNYVIIHDDIVCEWKLTTKNNEIQINHGICIHSHDIPQTTPDYFWTPIETIIKLKLREDEHTLIKQYIHNTNEEIERGRIIKLYNESIS